MKRTTVSINEDTYQELTKVGIYGESMNDIVGKCVKAYKKLNKL